MIKESIYPNDKLRVILRDDSPLMFADDSPSYRSIEIILTPEQIKQIELKWIGNTNGNDYYEEISKIFIEPEEKKCF